MHMEHSLKRHIQRHISAERRPYGDQLKMDRMSELSNSSDKEESDRGGCCLPLCRWFFNDEDISFTRGEICFFDQMAKNYNLAKFEKMKTDQPKSVGECLVLYFQANFEIVQGKSDAGENYVQQGLQVAKKLPWKQDLYFLLLASPRARVLYMKDDIVGLRHFLDTCFQKVGELGQGGIPGSVLGWLLYMRARSHKNDTSEAETDFRLAIDAFKQSETTDKDYGVAHARCRLIICILECGEQADTIDDTANLTDKDKNMVESLFEQLAEMEIVHKNIVIRIIYQMAESDYYFRNGITSKALERARSANKLAVENGCLEFEEVTKVRLDVYTRKCSEKPKVHRKYGPCAQQKYINVENAENVNIILDNDNT